MGYALGVLRLSFADFCALTFEEFHEVCKAYQEQQDEMVRNEWERMRLQTCQLLAPYTKKPLQPHSFMPFPWDAATTAPSFERMTAEQARARRQEVLNKLAEWDKKRQTTNFQANSTNL